VGTVFGIGNRNWRAALLLCAVAALAPACGKRWTLKSSLPSVAMQWPFQPRKPKLTYARSLSGLVRKAGAGSVLR
jgi:hypothetical protein